MDLSQRLEILKRHRQAVPVDVERLASDLGLNIHYAFLDSNISGMLECVGDDQYRITVNASDPRSRQRFTVAHEIGHYLKHRHLIGDGLDDDRAYRSTAAGKYHNTAIGPKQETEANKLAASILMPQDSIDEYVRMHGKQVKKLADIFGVSEHAMSIQLGVEYVR